MHVDTTTDNNLRDDFLSLREAMLLARGTLTYAELDPQEKDNVVGGGAGVPGPNASDSIIFDAGVFPTNATNTIQLTAGLPLMDGGGGLDGVHAKGDAVNGRSNVWVRGTGTSTCFQILSNQNVIAGLQISDCATAINVPGGDSNTIGGTTSERRNTIVGNGKGILLSFGATGNDVSGNVMNQNTMASVHLMSSNTMNNEVAGNIIGTDLNDTKGIGGAAGVLIDQAANHNTIGGDTPALRNIISGNDAGVRVDGATSIGNSISGNFIGLNAAGDAPNPERVRVVDRWRLDDDRRADRGCAERRLGEYRQRYDARLFR